MKLVNYNLSVKLYEVNILYFILKMRVPLLPTDRFYPFENESILVFLPDIVFH